MTCTMFNLQFAPDQISSLANQYLETGKGAEKDAKMEQAGKDIIAGKRSRKNLGIIYRWKAARAVRYLSKNKTSDIERCLTQAIEAKDDRSAVTSLVRDAALKIGLHGVRVPVASAILTAIDPDRFTVIDYKALASLGCPQDLPGVGFYLAYLSACRRIAQENKTSLRTLDRAVWQWWTNQEKASA